MDQIAPQDAKTIAAMKPTLDQFKLTVDWHDAGRILPSTGALQGTPINLGTYVGAAQVREAVIGDDDRVPTPAELEQMKDPWWPQAMKDGAMGLSTALIYPPGHYAKTDELIELAEKRPVAFGGLYASHMRSEGATEMAALDEAIRIGREGGLPVEVFHLKVTGKPRWDRNDRRSWQRFRPLGDSGLDIRRRPVPLRRRGDGARVVIATLGGGRRHGEDAAAPPGYPHARAYQGRHGGEITRTGRTCTSIAAVVREYMISAVVNPDLQKYEGKTVAEIAKVLNKPEMDALFDFILADKGQTAALYFMANENDLQYGLKQDWTSIGLDAGETSLDECPLFEPHTHPQGLGCDAAASWSLCPRFEIDRFVSGRAQDHLIAGAARTSFRPWPAKERLLRRCDYLRSRGHS